MKWGDEEEKGCFRVQNSWGEKCHNKGFFWMPYRFLDMDSPQEPDTKLVQDPWTLMGSHDEK
jgi:C1A family cysteine protease